MLFKAKLSVSGRYRCIISEDANMRNVTHDTGWFNNLITNNGLERLGLNASSSLASSNISNILGEFHVGTGTATPSVGDVAMGSYLASTSSGTSLVDGPTSTGSFASGYRGILFAKQFGEGVAAGNLSEIGLGPAQDNLFSRALILDGGGSPTTITVLSNEFLTVYYELRTNIPQTDINVTRDITINGSPVSHDLVFRAAAVEGGWWGVFELTRLSNSFVRIANAGLGDVNSFPSGLSVGGSAAYLSYVGSSRKRLLQLDLGLNVGNITGGISRIAYHSGLVGFQFTIDPPLAKDETNTLTVQMGWEWAREGEL